MENKIKTDIVKIARKEIGYKEFPSNSNKTKYGKWFGLNGVAWCGIFVSWCYSKAGFTLKGFGFTNGFAGCQTMYFESLKNGLITRNPKHGDIVLFDWNKDGRYDHTGIFDRFIDDKKFISIEGNTSIGNDSNGGLVMERERNIKDCVFISVC